VRSIEFRFNTTGGEARSNLADTPIGTRDGATFTQSGNLLTATASLFVNSSAADLHLRRTATAVIDQAPALSRRDERHRWQPQAHRLPAMTSAPMNLSRVVEILLLLRPPTGLTVTPIAASEGVHKMKALERKKC